MKPNLLYIFADQWRYHAQGHLGLDPVMTPHMDHFCQEGLSCSQAYSTFPLCTPHRGSLMTGKYPYSLGLWTNCKIGLKETIMLKPQEVCIGNVLKDQGYETGYIGKWHLDASEQNFTSHPKSGASHWDAYTPPGERRQGFDYWLSYGAWDDHLNPHYWEDSPNQITPGVWSAQYETDQTLAFLDRHRQNDRPFGLFLSYNPPHLPYELVPDRYYEQMKNVPISWRGNVPAKWQTKEQEMIARQYFAAVHGIDQQFGRILSFLREHHMEENTLVVLSADHGEMLGSHGLMSKNVWYEEAVHIPLVFRQKGRIDPGSSDTIIASPDHMPTLLQLLGIPVPDTCEGYGHIKSVLERRDPDAPGHMFLCSIPGSADMVGAFEEKGLNQKSFGWRGILNHRCTYVALNGYSPEEEPKEYLYDRIEDPWQRMPREISADCRDPEICLYRGQLESYLDSLKDPFLCRWKKKHAKEQVL